MNDFRSKVVDSFERLIEAPTWEETRRILCTRPELLTAEADFHILDWAQGQDAEMMQLVKTHFGLLKLSRKIGIDSAVEKLARTLADEAAPERPPELESLLDELGRHEPTLDMQNRAALCRKALAWVESTTDQYLYCSLKIELANALARSWSETRATDLEDALHIYRQVLGMVDRDAMPDAWATAMMNMGTAYADRLRGDPGENIELAIEALRNSLEVRTRETTPDPWADSLMNLGKAYMSRVHGSRAENIETAIMIFSQTLEVRTRESSPSKWALVKMNLGSSYLERSRGDHIYNIETAIDCYRAALEVMTREETPFEWAATMMNLGTAYLERTRGARVENVERAIRAYREALQLRTRSSMPIAWATTTSMLASAHSHRLRGDREENLETALRLRRQALEELSQEAAAIPWALTMMDLGNDYSGRMRGSRAENLEKAIDAYRQTLEVFSRRTMPFEWAHVKMNLGLAMSHRIIGKRSTNLDKAIDSYQDALEVLSWEDTRDDWLDTKQNLATALSYRLLGDREENEEKALEIYYELLEHLSHKEMPLQWGQTMQNLSALFHRRLKGDHAANIEQAIVCCRLALKALDRNKRPEEWVRVAINLGGILLKRVHGNREENIENAIDYFREALDTSGSALPDERRAALLNLGSALSLRYRGHALDNVEQSIEFLRQALELCSRDFAPKDWATAWMNLGSAYSQRLAGDATDNVEEAISCYLKALEVFSREETPDDWSDLMRNLGNAFINRQRGHNTENAEQAIRYFRQALDVQQPDTLPERCRGSAHDLGDLFLGECRWQEASECYLVAIEATENLYRESLLPSGRFGMLAEESYLFQYAAYALARQGDLKSAVVVLEHGMARRLGEILARDKADLKEIEQEHPELHARYERAIDRLRILEIQDRDMAANEEERGQSWQLLYEEARQSRIELNDVLDSIRSLPGFEGFLESPSLENIASIVEPAIPLVYVSTSPIGGMALVVYRTRQESDTCEIAFRSIWLDDLYDQALDQLLVVRDGDEVIGGYVADQVRGTADLKDSVSQITMAVGRVWAKPVADCLRQIGARRVVIVSGGLLGLLPLHAARYQLADREIVFLDEFVVGFTPSANVLKTARNLLSLRSKGTFKAKALVGVSNPLPHPSPLQYARLEAQEVSGCFPVGIHRFLSEESATKEALLHLLPEATHVHLCCHAVFDTAEPLNSRLELAGDPWLLKEILDQPPFDSVSLVVLSACQTAISGFEHLPDEAVGLPAGFLQAGASGVVGTLWPVDDLSTALLMRCFYLYLLYDDPRDKSAPPTPAEALRRAQLWLRELTVEMLHDYLSQRRAIKSEDRTKLDEMAPQILTRFATRGLAEHPFAAPYYWAPFVYIGA